MDTNGHESLLRDPSLPHAALVYSIVGSAFEVLREIGHGLHEKPYENALVVEFGLRNLTEQSHQQKRGHPERSIGAGEGGEPMRSEGSRGMPERRRKNSRGPSTARRPPSPSRRSAQDDPDFDAIALHKPKLEWERIVL